MSWHFHYRIKLERELLAAEHAALEAVCQRHGLFLKKVVRGVDWLDQWKGLVEEQELARTRRLYVNRPASASDWYDYADHLPVRSVKQLIRLVRWLGDVDALLPFDEFEVGDDYYIHRLRPSQVDLPLLEREAKDEPRKKSATPTRQQKAMMKWAREVVESIEGEVEAELEPLERDLEEARRQFSRWKARSQAS